MNTGINSLSDTITPKSDQLNADDLIAGPITVTILSVARGATKEQPITLGIDGGRMPYKPCKSMRRVMIAAWGDNGADWIGKRLTLYCDQSVQFGGVKVGGIRISHMSGIISRMALLLTTSKSKRKEYIVNPLSDKSEEKPAPVVVPPAPTPMPATVKAAAAKLSGKAPPTAIKSGDTITGDPSEGDLSDIGAPQKPDAAMLAKVANAFASIGCDAGEEYGKPTEEWTMADLAEAREVFKLLKTQQQAPADEPI